MFVWLIRVPSATGEPPFWSERNGGKAMARLTNIYHKHLPTLILWGCLLEEMQACPSRFFWHSWSRRERETIVQTGGQGNQRIQVVGIQL